MYWRIVGAVCFGFLLFYLIFGIDSHQSKVNYEQANVIMTYGSVPSPDYNATTAWNGEEWVKSDKDGRIVRTGEGVYLKLIKDEYIIHARADYGNSSTPAFKDFPWNGRGVVPLRRELVKNGKRYSIALNDIEVLVQSPNHPLVPEEAGNCVGAKLGFRCGVG